MNEHPHNQLYRSLSYNAPALKEVDRQMNSTSRCRRRRKQKWGVLGTMTPPHLNPRSTTVLYPWSSEAHTRTHTRRNLACTFQRRSDRSCAVCATRTASNYDVNGLRAWARRQAPPTRADPDGYRITERASLSCQNQPSNLWCSGARGRGRGEVSAISLWLQVGATWKACAQWHLRWLTAGRRFPDPSFSLARWFCFERRLSC